MHPIRRKEITALEDVSIHVHKGELFGLLGPNGAGKTTLLKILCTLVLPNEGTALVNGYDVARDDKKIRKDIGYVISEERSFYWRLTGRQNLKFFATLNNIPRKLIAERIDNVVSITNLGDDIDKVFKDYSSGMKQKLAVARGMLTDPQILFLDEPTRTLDPIVTRDLRNFIKDRIVGEEKRTVVLATNNMHEAEQLCDRLAIIHKGKVKICDSLNGIRGLLNGTDKYILKLRSPLDYVRREFSDAVFADRVVEISVDPSAEHGAVVRVEINSSRQDITEIIKQIISAGIGIESCYPEEESLEDIFKRVIG